MKIVQYWSDLVSSEVFVYIMYGLNRYNYTVWRLTHGSRIF